MKKILFVDRDGTLVQEPEDEQIDSLSKIKYYPGAIRYLSMICEYLDYDLVMVTNQDGLGTTSFPEETFWPAHKAVLQTFKNEGVWFKEVLIDRSFAEDNNVNRKPGIGMLKSFLNGDYDIKNSFVIGDRKTDVQLAENLGCGSILLQNQEDAKFYSKSIMLYTTSWKVIYEYLRFGLRTAEVKRNSKETEVSVKLNLDGKGEGDINTDIAFFDHMLDQLAKHSLVDLEIRTVGDLEVDEHHTIEDTAIALGFAFKQALADKIGLERYGFCLPMDDCLAQVAIDFGGRRDFVWKADFKREYVGKLPTEMLSHFFKSFADAAACNLNIKAEGNNEHHKIESIFKAFAKAIKMAIQRDLDQPILPTTKGVLV